MMAVLRKWNHKARTYEPYEVPDKWNVKQLCESMDEIINCAGCGKEITFGEGYSSNSIHDQFGLGFCVCKDCANKEWAERSKS